MRKRPSRPSRKSGATLAPDFAAFRWIAATLAICTLAFATGAVLETRAAPPANEQTAATGASLRETILATLDAEYFRPIKRAQLSRIPIGRLGAALHDPYTQYLSPRAYERLLLSDEGRYAGIGIHAHADRRRATIDSVSQGSPAAQAGLRVGDVIERVAGTRIARVPLERVMRRVRGKAGSPVTLAFRRRSRFFTRRIVRAEVTARVVFAEVRTVGSRRFGYVSVTEFSSGVALDVRRAVQRLLARKVAGVVLDLRHDPGGFVDEAVGLASDFLPRGTVVVRERGLHFGPEVLTTHAQPVARDVPLAILVDRESASASEIVAGAIRDNRRGVVVGERTFGKGVIQRIDPLAGGGALKLTFAEYRTPSGSSINHRGIKPELHAVDDVLKPGDSAFVAAARAIMAG